MFNSHSAFSKVSFERELCYHFSERYSKIAPKPPTSLLDLQNDVEKNETKILFFDAVVLMIDIFFDALGKRAMCDEMPVLLKSDMKKRK